MASADTQNTLLRAIFNREEQHRFDERGLAVYRANLRATATRSLAISFPTVQALVGDDIMRYAAEELLQRHPPHHGDWARWGKQLPDILAELDALDDYPFIPDCAALDYLCHQQVRAKDTAQDLSSLALLEQQEPDDIYVELAPMFTVFSSAYPVAEIRAAHKHHGDARQAALKTLLPTIQAEQQHYFASYRHGNNVTVEPISAGDYEWYCLLQQQSLGTALDVIAHRDWSFEHWLGHALQQPIISRFYTQ